MTKKNSVVEGYRDGQGDCLSPGCQECQVMARAGYGKSGCSLHKALKKIEVLEEENKAFRSSLEIAFDVLQYYALAENQPGNFDFAATEAIEKIDKVMDKVFGSETK